MSTPKMFTGPRVLRACLAVLGGCLALPTDMGPITVGWLPTASAAEPPPVIVRGRRIPVLPRRVARMEARGEILELRTQPPTPPVVIVERQPPVVIRERIMEGLAGRLPALLNPPAETQATRPAGPRTIEPATAIEPEPLPPIELLPTP